MRDIGWYRDANADQIPDTISNVSMSGSVVAPDRRGVRNARVSVADSSGLTREVLTNSFGFYSFDNVLVGQEHTFRVSSRRYRFAAKVISITGSRSDLDFIGLK